MPLTAATSAPADVCATPEKASIGNLSCFVCSGKRLPLPFSPLTPLYGIVSGHSLLKAIFSRCHSLASRLTFIRFVLQFHSVADSCQLILRQNHCIPGSFVAHLRSLTTAHVPIVFQSSLFDPPACEPIFPSWLVLGSAIGITTCPHNLPMMLPPTTTPASSKTTYLSQTMQQWKGMPLCIIATDDNGVRHAMAEQTKGRYSVIEATSDCIRLKWTNGSVLGQTRKKSRKGMPS